MAENLPISEHSRTKFKFKTTSTHAHVDVHAPLATVIITTICIIIKIVSHCDAYDKVVYTLALPMCNSITKNANKINPKNIGTNHMRNSVELPSRQYAHSS